jgi:lipopolysaccharide export system protein LptA
MKTPRSISPWFALAVLAGTLAAGPSPAPPDNAQMPNIATNVSGFDHIQFNHLDWNMNSGDYKIPDRFTAVRQGTELTADNATGNSKKKVLHALGHVIVHQSAPLKSGGDVTKITSQGPSTLTCDKLDVDGNRKIYVATGNVHFTQADREGTSDTGILDDSNHMLHMQGHVHLRDKEQTLEGDVVDYNTVTGEANVSGSPAIIRMPIETPTPGPPKPPAAKKKLRL